MTARSVLVLSFALIALACTGGSENDALDQRAILPAPPETGRRLMLPEITVEPGKERQLCVYHTLDNDEPMWIRSFSAYQGSAGHHLVAFTTLETEKDGTMIDCSSGERMAYWRLLFTPKEHGRLELPDGYAIKVEPRAKLVLQTHYVNSTTQPMVTQDAIDLFQFEGSGEPISIAPFVAGTADIEIEPGESVRHTYECAVSQDMQVIGALGHMHEWGKEFHISAGPAASPQMIYQVNPWTAEYRDQAPVVEWPTNAPLTIRKDEVVRVMCSWTSTHDETLTFPKEMCAGVLWFYPAAEPITCVGKVVE